MPPTDSPCTPTCAVSWGKDVPGGEASSPAQLGTQASLTLQVTLCRDPSLPWPAAQHLTTTGPPLNSKHHPCSCLAGPYSRGGCTACCLCPAPRVCLGHGASWEVWSSNLSGRRWGWGGGICKPGVALRPSGWGPCGAPTLPFMAHCWGPWFCPSWAWEPLEGMPTLVPKVS